MSKLALLERLRESNVQLNKAAEALFEDPRFTTFSGERIVEIASYSVAQLGFSGGASYEQLVARAHESGLSECPLELGPHLRLQFLAQRDVADGLPLTHGRAPPHSLTITSSPLDGGDETPKGFYLRCVDSVLWLRGYWSWSGHIWSPEDVLVFSRGNAALQAFSSGAGRAREENVPIRTSDEAGEAIAQELWSTNL